MNPTLVFISCASDLPSLSAFQFYCFSSGYPRFMFCILRRLFVYQSQYWEYVLSYLLFCVIVFQCITEPRKCELKNLNLISVSRQSLCSVQQWNCAMRRFSYISPAGALLGPLSCSLSLSSYGMYRSVRLLYIVMFCCMTSYVNVTCSFWESVKSVHTV